MRRGGHRYQTNHGQSADQVHFHIGLSWAQEARMQMLPLEMPGRYNFYVIIT
jgi:hypothetical protein